MSADANPSRTPILRPPATTARAEGVKFGLIGLGLGLTIALVFIMIDQRKASVAAPVFSRARTILLFYQAEKGAWPKDFDLAAPGEQFAGFKLQSLTEALAGCELPGKWSFVARTAEGWPAIVFTPAETGASHERIFGVVDDWLDDGKPEAGELRVRPDAALLRLTAE
jgi:hypothetical protein